MAYLLRFDGVNDRVTLPADIVIPSSTDFDLSFRFEPSVNADYFRPIGRSDNLTSRVLVFGGGDVRLTNSIGLSFTWSTGADISTVSVWRFVRVGSDISLYLDGALQTGTWSAGASAFKFKAVGEHSTNITNAADFYWLDVAVDGVQEHYYDASASGGTGSTLPDTVSSNDGTLVNFPTDDSQWVFYDDGGGTTIDAVGVQIAVTSQPAQVLQNRELLAALKAISVDPKPSAINMARALSAQVTAIALTAYPASVAQDKAITVPLQQIAVQPYVSNLAQGSTIAANTASIALSPGAVTLQQASEIQAALTKIGVTANAASATTGQSIAPDAAQIGVATQPASIELSIAIAAKQSQISLSALAASVGLGKRVDAFTQAITLTPNGVTLDLSTGIQADTAQITLGAFRAEIEAGVAEITAPGLEYTLPQGLMHYTMPVSRIHFTFENED